MAYGIPFRAVILDPTTSNLTGQPCYVGDLRQISLSVTTQTNSASRFTVIATNDDGFQSALGTPLQTAPSGNWSIITTITSDGVFVLDPGFRWMNAFRPSASSVTITITGRT